MNYVFAYVVVFGPLAAFIFMALLVGDGSLSVSWYLDLNLHYHHLVATIKFFALAYRYAVMAPLYPYELGVLLTSLASCDLANYQLYRADDLTRYVKQVDLRWLYVSLLSKSSSACLNSI
jgi:hypothetical protein